MNVTLTAYDPIDNTVIAVFNNITPEMAIDLQIDSIFRFRIENAIPYEDDGFQKDNELYGEIDE